jgi:hypothetical protein
MRIQIVRGLDYTGQTTRALSEAELKAVARISAYTGRASIYAMPFVFALWLWISIPVGLGFSAKPQAIAAMTTVLLFTPFVHEALHLLAVPRNTKHSETVIVVRIAGWRSDMAVRPGSRTTRSEAVRIALTPFVILTVIPFVIQAIWTPFNAAVGLMAAMNFALSTMDLVLATAWFYGIERGGVLKEEG